MTVSSEINKSGPYPGNGVTTAFDYKFKIADRTHVEVIRAEDGVETQLAIDVDYTVTGVGVGAGGQVHLLVPATHAQSITNIRKVPFTQETDLENQGAYYPETVEQALDLAAMRDQQLSERVDRSIKIPASADPSMIDTLVADVLRLSGSVDNIDVVADHINDVEAVSGASEDIEIVAQNLDDVSNFSKVYLGGRSEDPATRSDGSALRDGDLYVNTENGSLRYYSNSEWNASTSPPDHSIEPKHLDASRASDFRAVFKGDTFVNVKDNFGVKGNNDPGDWAKIQAALDADPIGDILFFPAGSYVGTVPLVMSRKKSMKLDPNAVLTLSSAVSSDDLLRIAVTNPASSDVRNMIIEGGTWIADARANCAINVNPANSTPGQNPHFETHIRNAMITGGLCAIRIGGATPAGDSNFNTIEGNNLAIQRSGGLAVNLDGCADGHRILNNLMFGPGTGIRLNLVLGAYQTLISGNCIVTRDGALLVTNGSNWHFERNQVEQQGGTNLLGQHIQVQGLAYPAKHWRIVGNNFGGGADVNYSIWLLNAIAGLVDENQMQLCVVADIGLIDGGGGLVPKYNTIGARNTFRGARSIRSNLTDASRRMILAVSPGTESNKGIWRTASGFTNSNGWTQSNLRRIVDEYGILHWEGALNGGTLTAGTVIWAAQMPAWERPVDTAACVSVATGSGAGALNFGTNGDMAVISAPNAAVYLSGVSYPVKWWDTYDAMP